MSGFNKWLHQHNFSYKKPKGVPHKFDEEKQAAIELGHLDNAVIKQYDKTVNGEAIVDFLQHVRESYLESGTITLVLDGAGYHRSDIVKNEAKRLNIDLIYLPPYSPNLNPIERLW